MSLPNVTQTLSLWEKEGNRNSPSKKDKSSCKQCLFSFSSWFCVIFDRVGDSSKKDAPPNLPVVDSGRTNQCFEKHPNHLKIFKSVGSYPALTPHPTSSNFPSFFPRCCGLSGTWPSGATFGVESQDALLLTQTFQWHEFFVASHDNENTHDFLF